MGCWNWTCFISNLPITAWDDIVIIPIMEKNREKSNFVVYSDQEFEIAWPEIYWKYNDYGGIKNIKHTKMSKIYEKYILKENFKLYSYWEEKDLENELMNLEWFINDLLERGCVYLPKVKFSWNKQMGLIMIHKDIFENVVLKTEIDYFYNHINEIKAKVERYKELWKEDLMDIFYSTPVWHNLDSNNLLLSLMKWELIKKDWLILYKNVQKLISFCLRTRKVITPMCWSWSQMGLSDEYKLLNKFVGRKITKMEEGND